MLSNKLEKKSGIRSGAGGDPHFGRFFWSWKWSRRNLNQKLWSRKDQNSSLRISVNSFRKFFQTMWYNFLVIFFTFHGLQRMLWSIKTMKIQNFKALWNGLIKTDFIIFDGTYVVRIFVFIRDEHALTVFCFFLNFQRFSNYYNSDIIAKQKLKKIHFVFSGLIWDIVIHP